MFDSDWLKNLFGGTLGAKSAFDSASQGMKSGDDYMSFTGSTIKNPFESKMPPGGPSMSPSIPGMPSATGGKSSQLPEWANTEWGKRVYDITQTDPFGGTNDYYQNGQYVPDGGASMRPSPQPEPNAKPMIDPAQFAQPQVSMDINPARPPANPRDKAVETNTPQRNTTNDVENQGNPASPPNTPGAPSSNMGQREREQPQQNLPNDAQRELGINPYERNADGSMPTTAMLPSQQQPTGSTRSATNDEIGDSAARGAMVPGMVAAVPATMGGVAALLGGSAAAVASIGAPAALKLLQSPQAQRALIQAGKDPRIIEMELVQQLNAGSGIAGQLGPGVSRAASYIPNLNF